MGIFRGPGGSGDATTDSTTEALAAVNAAADALTSKNAAAASATAAASSATSASNSASSAATSATNASNSASSANTSASNASSSASSASSSATTASNASTDATASAILANDWATKTSGPVAGGEYSAKYNAGLAATSASNAASSASSASTSASTATTQASNALTSANNAASSATAASGSASTASTQAFNAATSASSASGSASAASTSASNAASSATSASASATTATTQAGIATTKASEASTFATNAATSASGAATSATNAATSSSSALSAQTAAEAARDATLLAYDNFDDRYLGPKSTAPTVDNDGNTLLVGALYYDTVSHVMNVWSGSVWSVAYASSGGALVNANNLSDVSSVSASRTNLGLGTLATQNSNAISVTGGSISGLSSLSTTGNATIGGNLTVNGTTTTVNTQTISVQDNMIYMNDGSTVANPDLGIAGNYNDGTYRHTGFFRDATDGRWKLFHQYTPEPDASPYIDTSHSTFALADMQANMFYGNLTGNVTGNATNITGVYGGTLTSSQITTGLGFTPYNATNPNGYTTNLGTVTSVAAITLGTSGTDLSSSVATNTTTPVITLNVPTASATNRGALSAADWSTFNSKQPAGAYLTTVTASSPLSGSGTAGSPIVISQANTTTNGYLSSTDWNTFNNKLSAFGSQTANYVYAAPNGAAGVPSFRALVAADIPTLNQNTTGTASNITAYTINQNVGTSNNVQFNSLGVGTAGSATAGEIRATNNVTAYYSSDRTLKENIKDVEGALDKVCAIGSKTFDWTDAYIESKGGEDGYFVQKADFGVIAQDVQAVFPQAVRTREDGTLAVDYEKLATLAFGAIKELVSRVEKLENK